MHLFTPVVSYFQYGVSPRLQIWCVAQVGRCIIIFMACERLSVFGALVFGVSLRCPASHLLHSAISSILNGLRRRPLSRKSTQLFLVLISERFCLFVYFYNIFPLLTIFLKKRIKNRNYIFHTYFYFFLYQQRC